MSDRDDELLRLRRERAMLAGMIVNASPIEKEQVVPGWRARIAAITAATDRIEGIHSRTDEAPGLLQAGEPRSDPQGPAEALDEASAGARDDETYPPPIRLPRSALAERGREGVER